MSYIAALEVPEEVGEGEEGEVVVCPLEASKAGDENDSEEELLDVFDHELTEIQIK